ncbi:unnamed protein product (macronuclear) [Paramecium tetraurelia]|uniref:Protein kinase domain-containing protein n=1 Tax=Paramecium tetraurelia TaxID=5888 RepID=A0DAM5_PARTE|nr:uncharacterized protein GSPATT00014999001 [Paramecium tetraurelia]CAK80092.1 unnamed protein product [Paramecium tetraurelia]|eukprot:XP_001447489.1 hypothetical protein (macronuclear) [Paramecium tetraurelia strain d4-2]
MNSYQYVNALFTVQVTRKAFLADKVYQLYLFQDEIVMTENTLRQPKYVIKLNLTTTINWIVQDNKIQVFSIAYQNTVKAFHAPKLQILKEMIAGRVFYTSITEFYQIQMLIGHGMSGEVYRCISNSGEYFAVKKCEKLKLASCQGGIVSILPLFQPQLIHEPSLLQSLQHPNIVKLKEVYTDQQYYYIVTELIKGRALSTELQSRPYGLSVAEAIKIMLQILDALIYISERGIMHRDINPHNIMKSDTIKLIDFGLSRKIKNQLIFPTSGTPGYIAPEVINFNKGKLYDDRADVYSLGCVLYKLRESLSQTKNIFQENKEGVYELRKNQAHPEVSSIKMEQLFVLLPYMLENDPNNRMIAKVGKIVIQEIENNNQQIENQLRNL